MKKTIIITLGIIIFLSLAACAAPAEETERSAEAVPTVSGAATPQLTEEPTPTPEPTPEQTPEPETAPIDLLGEKYNPFFSCKWPEGYTVNECRIGYVDAGEEKGINTIKYKLGLYVDDDIYKVIEYFTNFIGEPQDLRDIIENYQADGDLEYNMINGYSVELSGYPDSFSSEVGVTIRDSTTNRGVYYVSLSVCLDDIRDYDTNACIEMIDKNFEESVIKDLGGAGADVLREQHSSYLSCAIDSIETYGDNWRLVCGRIYKMDDKTANDYTDMLSQPIAAHGGAYSVDFMFEESRFSMMFYPGNVDFRFMSKDNRKNLCDYDWTMVNAE